MRASSLEHGVFRGFTGRATPGESSSTMRWQPGEAPPLFTPAALEAGAWLCRQYADAYAIPIVRIESWSQLRSEAVPQGFIGHEDTANGVKLGKTDPGVAFPWPQFLRMVDDAAEPPMLSYREGAVKSVYARRSANYHYWVERRYQGNSEYHTIKFPRRDR